MMIDPSKIAALSFDLDDTLYENVMVIRKAEASLLQWLSTYVSFDDLQTFDWSGLKKHLLEEDPLLDQDVSEWRRRTIESVMITFKHDQPKAYKISKEAMDFFVQERSKVDVKPETHDVLKKLKNYFPLVAISNGNLDLKQAGLEDYFKFVYQANIDLPKKPHPKMFQMACKDLDIDVAQLLHVGDHWGHDVQGADSAGCQAAWLSSKILDDAKIDVWQIKSLHDLLSLIPSSLSYQ